MQLQRYINLCYAISAILFAVVFSKAIASLADVLTITSAKVPLPVIGVAWPVIAGSVLGLALTGYLWVNPKVRTWSREVADELSKVTWPGWEETKENTMVVVVFSIIISGILATFDFFWKWLTDLILL